MIPLYKYKLCFAGGDDSRIEVTTIEIDADGYESDELGEGEHAVPSVVFIRDEPDTEEEGEQVALKLFELPAHRVIYIKNLGELDAPVARCGGDQLTGDEVIDRKDVGQLYVNVGASSND